MWFRRKREAEARPASDPNRLFDTDRGMLFLGQGVWIYPSMTIGEVMVQGLTFVRELPVGHGWLYSTTAARMVAGRRIFFSLQTFCGQLTSVSFGFPLAPGVDLYRDAMAILEAYKAFLVEELGPAPESEHDGKVTVYTFPWGTISAQFDPRAGFSSMTLRWTDRTSAAR